VIGNDETNAKANPEANDNDNCNANNYNNNNKCCKIMDRAYIILKDKETLENPDVYGRKVLTFVDRFTAVHRSS
jgi:hypothetical protein